MDLDEEVTTSQRGIQFYEIKFNCANKICYVRCTVEYSKWDFIRVFGFPVLPWKTTKTRVFYFEGWDQTWKISDHRDPLKAEHRFKLNARDHARDIKMLHSMWLMHTIHLAKKINE